MDPRFRGDDMTYRMRKTYIFLFCFLAAAGGWAQPISGDLWLAREHEWLIDLGVGWEIHSLFQPLDAWSAETYYSRPKAEPSFAPAADLVAYWKSVSRLRENRPQGLFGQNEIAYVGQVSSSRPDSLKRNFGSTYWSGRMDCRNAYAEWYFRATGNPAVMDHYTGKPRSIRRFGGFNSLEFDQASVGYRKDWVAFSFGRGRPVWGPFGARNLVLSSQSAAMDHLSVLFRYKKITAAFFTGFLEARQDSLATQNRYIAGHGIEYAPARNARLSLSEITVYSGPNRRFDWAYLNPLSPHLESELNDRENQPYTEANRSNAVWVASADWMTAGRFRLSASYLIDEFQFDSKDRKEGRPDATALEIRLAKSVLRRRSSFTAWAGYERVGTYTLRHESDFSQFISRDIPLGTPIGSDAEAWRLGANAILPFRVRFEAEWQALRQGSNGLLTWPYTGYDEYKNVSFPSGNVVKSTILAFKLQYFSNRLFECETAYMIKHFIHKGLTDQNLFTLRLSVHPFLTSAF
jgi:hypothetical protein